MKKKMSFIIAIVTVVIGLNGCGNTSNQKDFLSQSKKENVEEKDYKETKVSLPDGEVFCVAQDAEGVLNAYTFGTNSEYANYQKYRFVNKEWVLESSNKLNSALEKQKIKVLYGFYEGNGEKTYLIKTIQGTSKNEVASYEWYSFNGVEIKKEKNILYTKENDELVRFSNIQVLDDNSILVVYQNGQMILFDKDGNKKKQYKTKMGQFAKIMDDIVYTTSSDYKNIVLLDSQTEEKLCEIPFEISQSGVAFAEDEKNCAFVMSEQGIFQINETDRTTTEIIQGSKFSVYALAEADSMVISDFGTANDVFTVNYMYFGQNSRDYSLFMYQK